VSNALTRRIRAWWQSRLPATDSWTLTQRNIYIVPTRAGFMFLLVLVVMLLASINYQLSLGYVLTFLLAGAGFVSMHLTHNTRCRSRSWCRAPNTRNTEWDWGSMRAPAITMCSSMCPPARRPRRT
jgi:hypothetical protein